MFKHLDRHDVCESAIRCVPSPWDKYYSLALLFKVVDIDVPSDDSDILESLFGGCSVDMQFLSFRVGQHRDLGKGVVLSISLDL